MGVQGERYSVSRQAAPPSPPSPFQGEGVFGTASRYATRYTKPIATRLAGLSLIAALATGCSSTPDLSNAQARVQERATQVAVSMVGKPYHYGGNTPQRGFDCSGLVQYSYRRAGVRLPHGTDYLRRRSSEISSGDLRRGDLVFFNEAGKSSHVGIYIGDDRFVHAPSSSGHVYIGSLSSHYWRNHFNEARRLDLD